MDRGCCWDYEKARARESFRSAIINLDVLQISDYLHSGSPSQPLQCLLFTLKMTLKIWLSRWPPDPLMAEVKMASQLTQKDVESKHKDVSFPTHTAKVVRYCKVSGLYNATGRILNGSSVVGLWTYEAPIAKNMLCLDGIQINWRNFSYFCWEKHPEFQKRSWQWLKLSRLPKIPKSLSLAMFPSNCKFWTIMMEWWKWQIAKKTTTLICKKSFMLAWGGF